MKLRLIGFLSVFVFSFLLLGCRTSGAKVTIISEDEKHRIYVEVVKTDEEKRVGLMGRTELADGAGMLFVYEPESMPVIWMKNMLIPLDILFISKDMKINHIEESVPFCDAPSDDLCNRYSSFEISSYVLELSAGYVKKRGIKKGDEVVLGSGI